MEKEVEVDTTVIDGADAANIGCVEIVEELADVSGRIDRTGTLDQAVRVHGELTIEPVDE